jgi:hypothetical protein
LQNGGLWKNEKINASTSQRSEKKTWLKEEERINMYFAFYSATFASLTSPLIANEYDL